MAVSTSPHDIDDRLLINTLDNDGNRVGPHDLNAGNDHLGSELLARYLERGEKSADLGGSSAVWIGEVLGCSADIVGGERAGG